MVGWLLAEKGSITFQQSLHFSINVNIWDHQAHLIMVTEKVNMIQFWLIVQLYKKNVTGIFPRGVGGQGG